MDAMELDGVEHDPVTVENVDVYAGSLTDIKPRCICIDTFTAQRVSVIVKADQPVGNYWMRAPYVSSFSEYSVSLMTRPQSHRR